MNTIRQILLLPAACMLTLRPCIHFSTGGLGIFYQLGVTKYLLENYDFPESMSYSGISAGSFCAMMLSTKVETKVLDVMIENFVSVATENEAGFWSTLNTTTKSAIFTNGEFDVPERLFIGTCKLFPFPERVFINDFEDASDIVDACLVSSHVPFLCGTLGLMYRGHLMCDGGVIGKHDTPDNLNKIIDVKCNMFRDDVMDLKDVFTWNPDIQRRLYLDGYRDSITYRNKLDKSLIIYRRI